GTIVSVDADGRGTVIGAATRRGTTVQPVLGGGSPRTNKQYHLYGEPQKLAASKLGYQVYVLRNKKGEVLYVGRSGWEKDPKYKGQNPPVSGRRMPPNWEDRLRMHVKDSNKEPWIGEVDSIEVTSDLTFDQHIALEHELIEEYKPQGNLIPGEADMYLK